MAERVIWQRTVDDDKIAQRKRNFLRRFAVVAVVLYVLVVFLTGGAFIGALVPVVLLGGLWGSTVRFQSLNDEANPTMVVDGGMLRLGRMEIVIDDIYRFTTMATETQTSLFGKYSRIHIGKAVFRLDVPGSRSEPKLVEFGWPNMGQEGLDSVRHSLERELPDRWVEPIDLVEAEELPKGRRSRFSR